jgi:C4-dicarboxylate-binding protein DctP
MRFFLNIAVLMLAAVACVTQADEPILIRFSYVTGEQTPKGQGAALFKRLTEERLAGKVRVELYPRSQKFNDDEVMLALLVGDVELAAPSLAKFRSFSSALQIFDLPFLFDDVEAVHRFQASEAGQKLLGSMTGEGITGLAFWENGMRAMSTNRPLRLPGDLKGLIFRVEPSTVMQTQYDMLGVATVPMPFNKVRDALRLGLVTGQENAWSNIRSQNFDEFQSYFLDLGHSYLGYMLVTSNEFWDGLPPEIRAALDQIIVQVTAEVNRVAREKAKSDRQTVVAAGRAKVLTPTAAEREEWQRALKPLWKAFEAEIGTGLIAAARQANKQTAGISQ